MIKFLINYVKKLFKKEEPETKECNVRVFLEQYDDHMSKEYPGTWEEAKSLSKKYPIKPNFKD